jgi:hypothetical protein
MKSAAGWIAKLDTQLAAKGEDIVLRRTVGQAGNTINIDVICRAFVRPYRLKEEVASGIGQAVLIVIISPTQIAAAQWPGGTTPGQLVDPSFPRRTDTLVIKGRERNVEDCTPEFVDNVAVRFDMQVLG